MGCRRGWNVRRRAVWVRDDGPRHGHDTGVGAAPAAGLGPGRERHTMAGRSQGADLMMCATVRDSRPSGPTVVRPRERNLSG